jgi:uncharacterized protein YbaR (Trm112 family)
MPDPKLLQILRCPISKATLVQDGDYLISTDVDTRYRYTIQEGVPVFLKEDVEQLSKEEWLQLMQKHNSSKA